MSKTAPWARSVTYGAAGGTKAPDLLRYPPAGFRPTERRVRVGQGDSRWSFACLQMFTWGIQRLSGMTVETSDSPTEVTALSYTPVEFDGGGTPVAPSSIDSSGEATFGPDGMPFLRPGDTALLSIPLGPLRVSAPVRIVYVIDEENRKGFAYGTLPGHPESGEEAWLIDRGTDGSVWLTIRAFSRPSSPRWWLVYPVLRLSQAYYTRRYERALAGPIDE